MNLANKPKQLALSRFGGCMYSYNVEAIVLKSLAIKDKDKLFTLFTKTKGKLSVLAKGIRSPLSKRAGNLDTLNLISAGIHEDTNGYKYLTEVVCLKSFTQLKKTLKALGYGYYIAELLHKFVEDDHAQEKLFAITLKTLTVLDHDTSENFETGAKAVNLFEYLLARHLGYALTFEHCVACKTPYDQINGAVGFSLAYGGLVCQTCGLPAIILSKKSADFLYNIAKGSFGNFKNLSVSPTNSEEVLKKYLYHILEKELVSDNIFNQAGV